MKSLGTLGTHYANTVDPTTLATLWKVTRLDGVVFGFTDHDKDIVFGGLTYEAATGFTSSQIESSAALSVDNLELDGYFDSEEITQADIEAGVWDGAFVEVRSVNYRDLTMGAEVLRVGELGTFTAKDQLFVAELRGLMDRVQRVVTRLYMPSCTANLGDARCTVDIEALRVSGEVTAVNDRHDFYTDLASSSPPVADDEFTYGLITWTTGENAGRSMEVKQHATAGQIVLQLPMVGTVAIGDEFTIVPGCRKTLEECRDRYDNVVNFRGFPHIPGLDEMLKHGGS
jgi:uncharacterized phage protein (TIGR02218 family)